MALVIMERDAILHGYTSLQSDRDAILHGYTTLQSDRDIILAGHETLSTDRDFILDAHPGREVDTVLSGKTPLERAPILAGKTHLSQNRYTVLRGLDHAMAELDCILQGLEHYIDRDFIVAVKPQEERSFILQAHEDIPAGKTRRLTLFDTLNLRSTSIYRNPRDISTLQIVIGDLSSSRVPCTPLDESGTIYHVSDRPIQSISKVYVEGEPKTFGYRAYTSYQDETGQSIACVVFDNPQYDKSVSVACKGVIDVKTGGLLENPADIINYVFLEIQGYDENSIDSGEISRFYSDCLKEDLKIGYVLDESVTVKQFLDDLAMNIHARWMISDGKSVMRLMWL
ncbi:MAG: hypothetical protein GXP46_01995 [Deferribacteres bacterium]|nr:hypothetical protein [Deferribacteres bacterium]